MALVNLWISYLHTNDSLLGLPLLLIGAGLLLFGWRLWKVCVVITFALVGAFVGYNLAEDPSHQYLYAGIGALVLGLGSLPPVNYAIAVLGGLIGAGITYTLLTPAWDGLPQLWVAVGATGLAGFACSILYLREMTSVITAFEGGVLVLSGLIALSSQWPDTFNFFESVSHSYSFFTPFLLIVATVVGVMLQLADAKRRDAGLQSGG